MELRNFFAPRSVAVVGASADPVKVGYALLKNLLAGPAERAIYPVSFEAPELLGRRAYRSVADIENEVDLAVIAVRADAVVGLVRECGAKKIPAAIVISAGFRETGEAGAALEAEVARAAKESGIALLGPNCLGTIDAHADFNASFAVEKPHAGGIAFLSQSGAMGTAVLDAANAEGVGFSKFVSLGNEAALTELDFLDHLAADDATTAVLAYFEGIRDGRAFIAAAQRLTEKKPLVVLKAGRSVRGGAAVAARWGGGRGGPS